MSDGDTYRHIQTHTDTYRPGIEVDHHQCVFCEVFAASETPRTKYLQGKIFASSILSQKDRKDGEREGRETERER